MGYKPSVRTRWGWFYLALVLAAVAMLAAACGSSSSDQSSAEPDEEPEASNAEPSPVEVVQVAYRTMTEEAKTAKIDFTTTMSGLPNGMSFDVAGQGAVDFENQNANMVMRMPMGMGEVEMRQIGTVIYQRWPETMQAQMPGQKPWLRMDLDAMMQEQFGTSFSQMQGNAPRDPSQQLSYLQGVSDSVEELGEEEVRGEPTTHYRTIVDLEKAAEEQDLPEEARRAQEQMTQQLGVSELPMDVWIDEEGLIRRFEMNLPLPAPPNQASPDASQNGAGEGEMTIVEELYDFGTPVNVEPPPADETTDFAEIMATQQQKAPAPR